MSNVVFKVGNSHVAAYEFQGNTITERFRVPCKEGHLQDRVITWLDSLEGVKEGFIGSVNANIAQQIETILTTRKIHTLTSSNYEGLLKFRGATPPAELGQDLAANACGVSTLFPKENAIVVDFGTATTYMALQGKDGPDIQGLCFGPGIQTSLDALQDKTSLLPSVEARAPRGILGTDTDECMLAGVYYGQIGAAIHIRDRMVQEAFEGAKPLFVATGGFVSVTEDGSGFNPSNDISDQFRAELSKHDFELCPDLTAIGLHEMLKFNLAYTT